MTKMLELPDALFEAGVNVRLLDGWHTPARDGYYYREEPYANTLAADPAGHMHHHTATSAYTPNREKANAFAGLSLSGSERLYQEDYGGGRYAPVYTIANAYPAPISSGAGDRTVLELMRAGIEVEGRQGPDTPNWYGNTHYWNTEWVLDGTGAHIDPRVWEMMVTVCQVQNDLMGWDRANHIGHYHHTLRKIDLYDGRDNNANETVLRLRDDMEVFAVWANDITDRTWKTWFDDTDVLGTLGDARYYSKDDGTVDWEAETGVAWGRGSFDGEATYAEKVHALNIGFAGFATAIQELKDK
jgi:hypothetical protein